MKTYGNPNSGLLWLILTFMRKKGQHRPCNADEITKGLLEGGWKTRGRWPDRTVSSYLSQNAKYFERVGPNTYRLRLVKSQVAPTPIAVELAAVKSDEAGAQSKVHGKKAKGASSNNEVTEANSRRSNAKSTEIAPQRRAIQSQLIAEEVCEPELFFNGATVRISINYFERNQKAREICIRKWGYLCSVCKFSFHKSFGQLGKGFIHVHHLKPLSEIRSEHELDPVADLRPVCPNCHAMLHKETPALSIEKLRRILAAEKQRHHVAKT